MNTIDFTTTPTSVINATNLHLLSLMLERLPFQEATLANLTLHNDQDGALCFSFKLDETIFNWNTVNNTLVVRISSKLWLPVATEAI